MEYPTQQTPNFAGAVQSGFQIGQEAKMNNLKMLAANHEIEQKNQLNVLRRLAPYDAKAAEQLAIFDPDGYKSMQDYKSYKIQRGGQLANSVLAAPEPIRAQRYQEMISEVEKEFGQKPNIPSEYSPEAADYLKSIVAQSRQVEDVAKEQYEAPKFQAELAKTKAQTATEAYQQRNYSANIDKTRLESEKLGEEIGTLRAEREMAARSGLTPTGFKAQQQEFGKARGEKTALLNSANSKLPQLLNTVNELSELGRKATYTSAGLATDFVRRELNISPRDAAVARSKYIATVDNQILPLLRDTFGAAFTQKEGESLKITLGDPNKSPGEKEATLQAFIQQKVATLNSGAREIGIEPINPTITTKGKYSLVNGNLLSEGQTATNPKTGQKLTFRGGKWQ